MTSCAVEAAFSLPLPQERWLDMQTQQYKASMELLEIRKRNILSEHKRKMEVFDAEFQYWESMKKRIKQESE